MFSSFKYSFSLRHYSFPTVTHDAMHMHSVDVKILCDEPDDTPPEFYFSSHHLDDLTEPAQVWHRGQQLLNLYKAAQILAENARTQAYLQLNMQLVNLYDNKTNHSYHANIDPVWVPLFSATELANVYKPQELIFAQSDASSAVIYTARTNDEVLTLLLQLARGLSYQNLYSIGDTVETFAKKRYGKKHGFKKLLAAKGYTEADYKSFTGIANNFGLLGVEARHGELGFSTPQQTMSLPDSQYMVTSLCREYLTQAYGLLFPARSEPRPASDWSIDTLF